MDVKYIFRNIFVNQNKKKRGARMSFLDKIVVAIIQILFIVGIVFFIDKILDCCRGSNNHPIPTPQSNHYVPIPNPMWKKK